MNKKYILSIIIIVVIILIFSSYTYYSDLAVMESVSAEIISLEILNPTLKNVTIALLVNITNPSSRDISSLSSTFDIFIETNYIGAGGFSQVFLPSLQNVSKPVMINITYLGLAYSAVDVIKNLINGEKTTITIKGVMKANALFGFIPIEYKYTASYKP